MLPFSFIALAFASGPGFPCEAITSRFFIWWVAMQIEEGLNLKESMQLKRLEEEHSRAVDVANKVLERRGMSCLEFLEANETVRYLADRIAKLKGGQRTAK
jgi:hypothetical protein